MTKAIRLIIMSTESGENETVIFTEDENSPGSDFLKPGQSVDFDGMISADLPGAFPTDEWLVKS